MRSTCIPHKLDGNTLEFLMALNFEPGAGHAGLIHTGHTLNTSASFACLTGDGNKPVTELEHIWTQRIWLWDACRNALIHDT